MDINLLKKIIQKIIKEELQETLPSTISKIIRESVKEEIKNILFEQFTSGKGMNLQTQQQKQNSYPSNMSLGAILNEDEDVEQPTQQYYAPYKQPQRPPVNTGNAGINSILNEMVQTGYEHIPSEYAGAGNPLMEMGYGKGATANVNMSNMTGLQPGATSYMGSVGMGYLQKMSDDEVLITPHRSGIPNTSTLNAAKSAINRDYSAFMKNIK